MIKKYKKSLPKIKSWINKTLKKHSSQAKTLDHFDFKVLPKLFPKGLFKRSLLQKTKIVITSNPPVIPLSKLGFPEFSSFENMKPAGITYKDTFFVRPDQFCESICLHELVHVIQWKALGVESFILLYAMGLLSKGYRNSPLEEMAYTYQGYFDKGQYQYLENLEEEVKKKSRELL